MAQRSTKREDGRLVRAITDPRTGKRKYFYGATEREINKKIMEYTAKVESGRPFREVAEEWWDASKDGLAYQTIKVYKPALERAVEALGDISIRDIKPRDISALLQRMAKADYALKTVANQRTVINQVFRHAILECDIEVNPCASVPTPKNLKKVRRDAASTTDEDIVREHRDLWAFPYIALMTGMRKGEILALQWKDIDFDENVILVYKSLFYNQSRPTIKGTKTEAGTRIVPLLDDLKEFLLTIPSRKPNHYVISDNGKDPLSARRYQTLLKNFKEETGADFTAHQLRHSFATIAFENDVDAKSLQEIIGHKQLSTTMDIYADFRERSVKKAAEKLNNSSLSTPKK